MKIVLFPSAYAPHVGGVEELTARLADGLIGLGHAVEVWTVRHPVDLAEVERIGRVTVRRFALPLPAGRPAALARFPPGALGAVLALRRAARAFRPDVIHVQCFSANGMYAELLTRMSGARLVVSLQGETVMDDQDIYTHSTTLRWGLRSGLRRADVVTACSGFVLDDAVRRFGLAVGAGVVIPNGVEPAEAAVPEALELPFDRFVLAYGRVVAKKGFDLLVDAFARVSSAYPDIGLVIGGDGAARGELEQQVAAAGLAARVVFPGRLSRNQVAWATAAASLFVLPSRVEPFGIVVLEAMRAGLPVVVSNRGGAPDIVRDGVEGFVVDPTDTAGLSARIGTVLADPELAARLGAAGRERVTAFDWGAITRQYEALYR
jgi:glycogen(starch) synthase